MEQLRRRLEKSEKESCSVMSDSLQLRGLYCPWDSPGQNTGVGSLSLLQGIFPTQGSNPSCLHCRQVLYQMSHRGSPRIPAWEAQEGCNTYIYIYAYIHTRLIHLVIWWKPIQHCKAIILQLKINFKKRERKL